jgi:hypothetical protein
MTGSTPGLWVTDPEAYRKKMYGLLGDRDPIAVKAATADVLDEIVRSHTVEQIRSRPFEGKWTPNEVIGHLCDVEWVYGYRMRQILCEERPQMLGMDQDRWVSGQRYNDREPADLVRIFRAVRDANLCVWRQMTPADLDRVGLHNERGPESLGTMLRMLAGHDLSHIAQITRYLAAVT